MRRSLTKYRSGVAIAASLVLLTACGGSDDADRASESSAASGSSSAAGGGSTDLDTQRFCAEAAGIQGSLGDTLAEPDEGSLIEAMQQAADAIRAIDAPPEIAEDWNTLADGAEQIAAAFAGLDVNDPTALEELEGQLGGLTAELDSASTNIERYLAEECGIDPDAGPSN